VALFLFLCLLSFFSLLFWLPLYFYINITFGIFQWRGRKAIGTTGSSKKFARLVNNSWRGCEISWKSMSNQNTALLFHGGQEEHPTTSASFARPSRVSRRLADLTSCQQFPNSPSKGIITHDTSKGRSYFCCSYSYVFSCVSHPNWL
jgi:hypothetical protein